VNTLHGGYDGADGRLGGIAGARADLAQELNGPLAVCEALSEQEAADLLDLFRSARRTEAAALAGAIDGMIGVLPRPFRTVTKRIMFRDLAN
jgi:hypothetical protein